MSASTATDPGRKNRFGTFGGVFTPSILTIFGLIMFMRANQVIGNTGILRAFWILTLCSGITFLTSLSISAISTNTPVKGGGAYFLISRVLGPGFGTAIGVALFLAQALSVPFYILGFSEALTSTFPILQPYLQLISLGVLLLLFLLTWGGANWIIRIQYIILTILFCAIASFLVGAWQNFNLEIFRQNLESHYQEGTNFWTMFSLYFPAVTGIMAGVNMSGDLKDPARSIPAGTMGAILLGYLVYAAQIFLCGGMAGYQELINQPYMLLLTHAALGLSWLIAAGVFCATISSAIGSNLGAPRVLQAVGRDRTLPVFTPFAQGSRIGDEPRRALLVTFIIGGLTLVVAGQGQGKNALNMVAAVVSMVFLYTYGMTNLAAFVESLGSNPSFRPRFRFFHWSTALVGGIACVWSAFMIDWLAALLALLFIIGLFYLVQSRQLTATYGDARRGFIYSRVRNNLAQLTTMATHPKNWRPTILVFSGSPHHRLALIEYAQWLGRQSGIVTLAQILQGPLEELRDEREKQQKRLENFIRDHELNIFPEVIVLNDFDRDLSIFLQAYSIGPIKPNLVFLGWPNNTERLAPYYQHLRTVQQLGKSLIVLVDHGTLAGRGSLRIDCWWRGRQNGSLMVILAHLLSLNPEWEHTRLRLLRLVEDEAEVNDARMELEEILGAARISADICIPARRTPFAQVLQEYSSDAGLIMLGMNPPEQVFEQSFHTATTNMLNDMPSALLVYSSGEADLHA